MASLHQSLSNGFVRPPISVAAEGAIGNLSGLAPGTLLCGSLWDYTQIGFADVDEVQYSRVRMVGGKVVAKMIYYQSTGGDPGRQVRLGIYEQNDPVDESGLPYNKVAETAATPTNGLDGQYVELALTATFIAPAEGYYWLAFLADSTDLMVGTSEMYGPDFLPIRRGPTTGIALPASPGIVVNPSSATVLVLALEA
jgi:hypothetical protein